jgi:hypothetical protein
MDQLTPILVGIEGMAAGEHFVIERDHQVTVGRSSSCDISLQRVPRYQAMTEEQRAAQVEFQAISRKHILLQVTGWMARIENCSQSGTWCDDVRLETFCEIDLGSGGVTLRMGPRELMRLLLVDRDGLDQLLSSTRPMPLGTTRVRNPEDDRLTKRRSGMS